MSRSILAAAALGALAVFGALPAADAQQTAGAQQRRVAPGKLNICTTQQSAIVAAGFARAEVRIAQAIAFLDANPDHEHVTRWFGDARRKLIRVNLTLIQEGLREGNRPRIVCSNNPACASFAFATRGQVTLCQRYFDSGTEGQDSHYGTLIHEISHLVAGTRDAAYQPFAARLLAQREPVTAATNADSYQYFVEFMPE